MIPLHPLPLAATAAALRTGSLDLHAHIDALCDRSARDDALLQSLLPEEGRRARLHAAAAALLDAWPQPATRPPLFGVAVAVKDIIHVDGFVTRAGSAVPPESFAGAEAAIVHRLRAAGALLFGKSVTTEFAFFEPGPTRNPHALDHTPGGSSSGSAAAVAAGLCALAVGTQTIGSVIRPAAFCGVVGFKPTLHRIPSAGIVYFSPTVDTLGLFTQDAAGMALAAGALLEGWAEPERETPGGERALPVLGIPEGAYLRQADDDGAAGLTRAAAALAAAGVRLKVVPLLAEAEELEALNARHRRLVFAEFARQHAERFATWGALYRPRTRAAVESGRAVADGELEELRASMAQTRAAVEAQMEAHALDAWLTPAAPGAAPAGLDATGDPALNLPWTHTGQPALTLPAGRAANGLPLGVQLVARAGADEALLAWGQALEPLLAPLASP